MNREALIQNILHSIGTINREFTARGNYPFQSYALGRSHMEILFLLSRQERSIKQLAEHLYITSGAVTQLVDFLASKKLVVKKEDPQDKRSRLVRLTAESASTVRAFEKQYVAMLAGKFDDLTDEDLDHLYRILDTMRRV